MNDQEYRALVEAGPAVVMVAKEDMLKLLDWAEFGKQANITLQSARMRLINGDFWDEAMESIEHRISKAPPL